ncbi:MAG: aldo/keto reductase [Planctomycetales bacterium]|nr:aldo/keto reductase [Planctomycetales bacterium]MCC0022852.1 aldo/keto reductase [Hyphomicrobiaceae bacterium]
MSRDKEDRLPGYGFGTSGLGNLGCTLSESEAREVLESAWQSGFRYFDTAPLYGHGLSELRVGQFLREQHRDSFMVSTKVGRYLVPPLGRTVDHGLWTPSSGLLPVIDYSYEGTMRSLEQSHSRLGLDRIDIVFIHDLDRRTQGAAFNKRREQAVLGAYKALDELRRAGHIKMIGIGLNEADVAANFIRDVNIDIAMIAGRYTLLDQSAAIDCLPTAMTKGTKIVAAGVFNSGILASGAVPNATYDYSKSSPEILSRVVQIERVCLRHGTPIAAVAAQFSLAHPAVCTVVLGGTTAEHAEACYRALTFPVPHELWKDLYNQGLLPTTPQH